MSNFTVTLLVGQMASAARPAPKYIILVNPIEKMMKEFNLFFLKRFSRVVRNVAILMLQLVSIVGFGQHSAGKFTPKTGDYEGVVQLAYDTHSGEISGYIKMDVPSVDNPKLIYRTCAVMFIGRFDGKDSFKVNYYNSDIEKVSGGQITFVDGKIHLVANIGTGYCNDILDLTDGDEFEFTQKHPYRICRAIGMAKVYVKTAPADSATSRVFLVKGDFVLVMRTSGGWINIEYIGKKIIDGWIRRTDLAPMWG